MISCVFDETGTVRRFVASLIPTCRERGLPEASTAIGALDGDGHLVGGMVYHNWDPDAGVIEMSAGAIPGCGWLTRDTLKVFYGYPFDFLKCQMVIKRTEPDNSVVRQLAAYGYSFVRIPRLFGRDRDGVLCTLTVEDWRANKFNRRAERAMREAA